ncbi:MAG: hypothetical protein JO345_13940 [Streptosporangiaceae bacterium]|nr:hypothetical protein [Streptosporangiaceae bacterium]
MKTKLALAAVAAFGMLPLTAAGASAAGASATSAASATLAGPASGSAKLIVVYLENHSLGQIVGNPDAPYLNSLWTSSSAEQFTQFYGVKHGSFNNYAAFAVGEALASGASKAGQFSNTTVWDQLSGAGDTWGVYEESVPTACYKGATFFGATGEYKIGHNPAMPFASIADNPAKCDDVKPLSALVVSKLPDVSFVTPNLCDDMHGVSASVASQHHYTQCVTDPDLVKRGDSWIMKQVQKWTANDTNNVAVLIMFDEGEHSDSTGRGGTKGGGHIYAVLTGKPVTGGQNSGQYNAYNLLAGVEKTYSLTRLGNAATSTPIDLP